MAGDLCSPQASEQATDVSNLKNFPLNKAGLATNMQNPELSRRWAWAALGARALGSLAGLSKALWE